MKVDEYISNEADFLTLKEKEDLKKILNCVAISGGSDGTEKEIKKVLEK